MFIDKDQSLAALQHLYQMQNPCCLSLYSYPGQGKTALLRAFLKEKKAVYFKASCVPWQENFRCLQKLCMDRLGKDFSEVHRTSDLIKALKKAARTEPLVLVLDNFHYLSSGSRRLYSQLSALEKEAPSCRLFIVLCKPTNLWEKEASRETHALRLRDFHFFELERLYPELSSLDQLLLYSVTGGNPGILSFFPNGVPIRKRLEALFFCESGLLYRLIPSQLQNRCGGSPYISGILAALGPSLRHLQEICDQTGLTPSAASSLLGALESHGIVKKVVPVTEPASSRRALYKIIEGPFRFWFSHVYPWQSEIEAGKGAEIFQSIVQPLLPSCAEEAFTEVCRDFLRLEQAKGTAPFPMEQIGMWWGQHPTKKRTESITIAASGGDRILLGACFFTQEWLDVGALSDLQKQAGLFPDKEKWYCLFSTSDFVTGFEAIFGNHVRIFSLEEMCRIMNNL